MAACFWLIGASRLLCIPVRIDNAIVCKLGWQISGDATDIILRLPAGCAQVHSAGDAAYQALAKHCPEIQVLRLYASMPSALAIQGFHVLSKLRIIDICGAPRSIRWPFQARCYS